MDDAHVTLIMGRLDSIERSIVEEKRDSAESRRRVYEKLEGQDRSLQQQDRKLERIDTRVETLEKAILTMSPTVAEFVTMKTQAQGAGKLGKFVWSAGKLVIAGAASAAATWAWAANLFGSGKP